MSEVREEVRRTPILTKSPSLSRQSSPTKSPPLQKKCQAPGRAPGPGSSPLLGRPAPAPASCKDNFDYEESLALALALSRSIYLESPLPVIPGLSCHKPHQDVLAHPHRDVSGNSNIRQDGNNCTVLVQMTEDGQYKREYREGVDWTKGTVLGTGAYSTCYQARDVETGTLMAAKQISFCRNSEEEQERVETLIREEVLLISGKGVNKVS